MSADVHPQVRRWLSARSYRAVPAAEALLAAKGSRRISVVVPALNEQRTVGGVVGAVREGWMGPVPLVDELVVMDGGSRDATARVAADCGARVVRLGDGTGGGPPTGKGGAMWRSLSCTSGDLLVFLDADVEPFDADWVAALVFPLLVEAEIALVKGAYERPLDLEPGTTARGGRVTELVARPLINAFWPELAGFRQPLAGECAARRTLLERLPFATGYGVEIGLLIDALAAVGLEGLAQVDLGRRRHRHQDDDALARMASVVLRTGLRRLPCGPDSADAHHPSPLMLQFSPGPGGLASVTDLPSQDLPPAGPTTRRADGGRVVGTPA